MTVVLWRHVNARATGPRGRISSRVKATRFPRATMPCGSTEFPPSRKTTSWPSMTARTDRRVVRWNTKSEPLSISVILPGSNGPRIRSRVGTRVVRPGRVSTRTSGTTMVSAASAMESSPRFDGDGDIKAGAEGRGDRKYPARDTYSDGVTPIQWATSVALGGCDAFRSLGASRRGGNRRRPPVLRLLTFRALLRAFLRHHCGGGGGSPDQTSPPRTRGGGTGGNRGGAPAPGRTPPPCWGLGRAEPPAGGPFDLIP